MQSLDVLGYYLSHFDAINTGVIEAILDINESKEGARIDISNAEGKNLLKNYFTNLGKLTEIELNTINEIINKK